MRKLRSRRNGWSGALRATAFVLALVATGCKGSAAHGPSAAEGLPAYTAEEAALFDDGIAPAAFGLAEGTSPSKDPTFYDRLKRADAVFHGRISTVTEEALAGKNGYSLSVVIDGAQKGSITERVLELRIPPGSAGLARMQASSTVLVGKRVLLSVRRFARGDEVEMHFHADADDAKTREALRRTKPLDETANEGQTGN